MLYLRKFPLFFYFVLFMISCGGKPIAYNSVLVDELTSTHEMIEKIFTDVNKNPRGEKAKYTNYADQYAQINGNLNSIISTSKRENQSSIVIKQIETLHKSVRRAEFMHQRGFTEATLPIVRETIADNFSQIFRLQNAAKENVAGGQ